MNRNFLCFSFFFFHSHTPKIIKIQFNFSLILMLMSFNMNQSRCRDPVAYEYQHSLPVDPALYDNDDYLFSVRHRVSSFDDASDAGCLEVRDDWKVATAKEHIGAGCMDPVSGNFAALCFPEATRDHLFTLAFVNEFIFIQGGEWIDYLMIGDYMLTSGWLCWCHRDRRYGKGFNFDCPMIRKALKLFDSAVDQFSWNDGMKPDTAKTKDEIRNSIKAVQAKVLRQLLRSRWLEAMSLTRSRSLLKSKHLHGSSTSRMATSRNTSSSDKGILVRSNSFLFHCKSILKLICYLVLSPPALDLESSPPSPPPKSNLSSRSRRSATHAPWYATTTSHGKRNTKTSQVRVTGQSTPFISLCNNTMSTRILRKKWSRSR